MGFNFGCPREVYRRRRAPLQPHTSSPKGQFDIELYMKKRVSNLFDLAENDAKEADRCVASSPNLAAFHAQQCAEKSLKAFCLELSDIDEIQEEGFLRKIGHDSIRAVMKSVARILNNVFERSGYNDHADKFKTPTSQIEMIASAIYRMFPHFVGSVIQQIDDLSTLNPENAWIDSFDEKLEPELRLNLDEAEKQSLAITEGIIDSLGSTVGLGSITKTAPSSLITQINDLAGRFESEGNAELASAFRRASEEANRLAALGPWIKVCSWAPYLDAHAVVGRYPRQEQLEVYRSRTLGVKNMIEKAKQIMTHCRSVLDALAL